MKFYTIKDLMKMLDVSYGTIYNLIKEGKIKHFTVGRQIRITQEEVERISKEGVK